MQRSNVVAIDWWWKRSSGEVYQVPSGLGADAGTGGSVLGEGEPCVPLLRVLCIQKANKKAVGLFTKIYLIFLFC